MKKLFTFFNLLQHKHLLTCYSINIARTLITGIIRYFIWPVGRVKTLSKTLKAPRNEKMGACVVQRPEGLALTAEVKYAHTTKSLRCPGQGEAQPERLLGRQMGGSPRVSQAHGRARPSFEASGSHTRVVNCPVAPNACPPPPPREPHWTPRMPAWHNLVWLLPAASTLGSEGPSQARAHESHSEVCAEWLAVSLHPLNRPESSMQRVKGFTDKSHHYLASRHALHILNK